MQADLVEKTSKTKNHNPAISPQTFLNGEIHDWYRTVFGYSDHLVGMLLDKFECDKESLILDPFCGSGTTLVECMKRGVNSVGIDANPASQFAAKVKTNWSLNEERIIQLLSELKRLYSSFMRRTSKYKADPTFVYLDQTGMLERGWISDEPLRKALALKAAILKLNTSAIYINFFLLALLSELVDNISNIKFGPTLYCGPIKQDVDVIERFEKRILRIAADLTVAKKVNETRPKVLIGDARDFPTIFGKGYKGKFSTVITSPPYPSEHDYTRNSQLELAFLEKVSNRQTLQVIKKTMLRSNTKGIYKEDNDNEKIKDNKKINAIIKKIEPEAMKRDYGFARLYTTVIANYFGGMHRHLASLKPYLRQGANMAYIVGDQSSYFQIHIPTAEILGQIAEKLGYEVVSIDHWRSRWASASSKVIKENILFLRNI